MLEDSLRCGATDEGIVLEDSLRCGATDEGIVLEDSLRCGATAQVGAGFGRSNRVPRSLPLSLCLALLVIPRGDPTLHWHVGAWRTAPVAAQRPFHLRRQRICNTHHEKQSGEQRSAYRGAGMGRVAAHAAEGCWERRGNTQASAV